MLYVKPLLTQDILYKGKAGKVRMLRITSGQLIFIVPDISVVINGIRKDSAMMIWLMEQIFNLLVVTRGTLQDPMVGRYHVKLNLF